MKKLAAALIGVLLSFSAFSEPLSKEEEAACLSQNLGDVVAQQGCCSWHGGVCGCQNGRVVCCDGRYSPSCTCNKESVEAQDLAEIEA